MHIKKNVFENIFNMLMDIKGKTRNNIKTRKYIPLFFHYKNIKFIYDGPGVIKPKVIFSLNNNAQLLVCQWLESLYFSYGYASHKSKLVNLMDDRFYEIKSHDYHMVIDTIKRLMSSPKCRSVKIINNLTKPGSNYKEVNCINYK